ncbi:helix-turn-helix transcriptional regulator [Actinoplanes bogorensis]|uniref:Helix-turn-helix transcriptional regulator n=1 Tax=Paractinoplanes bogorensis TaxID=1610840 RepID=A0ABS5Z0S2_9ACTN|nr:helix-turn-helix transcriptional regulator [Actinoplanes bogorensis]MBU2669106.1 helix-turn-helix transcriptional regulator [Actinoplanes bogorensis]
MGRTRTELGLALRSWRERVAPADVGLPPGSDRRVPGLRREELALLVGISVDYLVQLEQGRSAHPSAQVLGALARALRLGPVDRDLLYRLAGSVPPPSGSVPRSIPPGVQQMIDRMSDTPLAVFTAAWDPVQWNPLWAALFDGSTDNLARGHFAGAAPPGASRVSREPAHTDALERRLVADLRRAAARYPDDRAVAELISGLRAANPRFAELWSRYYSVPQGRSRKTVVHADLGEITLDCDILTIECADLHIVLNWAAPGTRDAALLQALRDRVAEPGLRAVSPTPEVGATLAGRWGTMRGEREAPWPGF